MTIQEMREKKRDAGYSDAQVADWSGVSLETVKKFFSGETETPGYDTLQALDELLKENRSGLGQKE